MVTEMCGEQLKDRKTFNNLLLMLGSNEVINQLTILNSVQLHDHVMRISIECDVERRMKKGRQKRTWKS